MSTTPEDHTDPEDTGRASEGAGQPTFEPATAVAEAPEAGHDGPEHTGGEPSAEEGAEAAAAPAGGGAFSAETFALVGLALLAVTILSGQLVQILTSMILVGGQPIAAEQIAQIRVQIAAGGTLALLTVVASLLSLALRAVATRPWARWAAMAGTIVGALFVLVGATAFLLIPEAAPPQPMMPPF
ncbi:hypothetical protein [Nocardiopsis sp. CC223A]|uniref:hypothetical protein n=1 Tax=Nocardiopsis sp. CC223A TaxID=3044051 RepID=UPI00278C5735|nr:hypothetical protein [Nocardiopsis sp. CC223A]